MQSLEVQGLYSPGREEITYYSTKIFSLNFSLSSSNTSTCPKIRVSHLSQGGFLKNFISKYMFGTMPYLFEN